jgi:hypothetical protein
MACLLGRYMHFYNPLGRWAGNEVSHTLLQLQLLALAEALGDT